MLQVASKLSSDDKATVSKAIDETIEWLDANQLAEEEEFSHKREELEKLVSPIMAKLYQGEGGSMPGSMPGGMPGGMPGAGSGAPPSSGGPTIMASINPNSS